MPVLFSARQCASSFTISSGPMSTWILIPYFFQFAPESFLSGKFWLSLGVRIWFLTACTWANQHLLYNGSTKEQLLWKTQSIRQVKTTRPKKYFERKECSFGNHACFPKMRSFNQAQNTKIFKFQIFPNGSLSIHRLDESDQGDYTCSVQNIHGNDQIVYEIIIQGKV